MTQKNPQNQSPKNPADEWVDEFGFKELVQKEFKITIQQRAILDLLKLHGEEALGALRHTYKRALVEEVDAFFDQTLQDLKEGKLSLDQPGIVDVEKLLADAQRREDG